MSRMLLIRQNLGYVDVGTLHIINRQRTRPRLVLLLRMNLHLPEPHLALSRVHKDGWIGRLKR